MAGLFGEERVLDQEYSGLKVGCKSAGGTVLRDDPLARVVVNDETNQAGK